MPSSRKLPCSLTRDGRASTCSEHLMPDPWQQDEVFVGIRSGRRYRRGYIGYVGEDVTAADILSESKVPLGDDAIPMLESFLRQLPQFKIDNVIAVRWHGRGLELVRVAEHTVRERREHPLP